jgi:hypothetical protein
MRSPFRPPQIRGAMVDSLDVKRAGTGLIPKKKGRSIPPKLTEAEQDLCAHMGQGYHLGLILSVATRSCAD